MAYLLLRKIYNYSPKFDNLRVFGCFFCFGTKLNILDKFSPKFENYVLIGYSNKRKGYKLLSIDTSLTFFSRDVKVYENVFPFKMKSSQVASKDLLQNGQYNIIFSNPFPMMILKCLSL